jgi:hypothetical protein
LYYSLGVFILFIIALLLILGALIQYNRKRKAESKQPQVQRPGAG